MIQRLFGLLLALGLGWLLSRMLRNGATRVARGAAGSAPGPTPQADRGAMVRDRVCNTFLPASQALNLEIDGTSYHFCSAACRDRFLAQSSAGSERP